MSRLRLKMSNELYTRLDAVFDEMEKQEITININPGGWWLELTDHKTGLTWDLVDIEGWHPFDNSAGVKDLPPALEFKLTRPNEET